MADHGAAHANGLPRVAITDYSFPDLAPERAVLDSLPSIVEAGHCRTEDEVIALAESADYVITQFAPLTARVIAALQRVKLIVRYGIGVDNIDLAAAAQHGIPVFNIPDFCIDEVADHTLGLILALTRQIPGLTESVRAGSWTAPIPLERFTALKYLTVGVVGCGRIGRGVIQRLQPFGPQIAVYDPILEPAAAEALGCRLVSLQTLWRESDLITLHLPSTAQTRHLVDAGAIAAMKHGVLLVNVSRGAIIDTPALVEALRSGKIAGAALDVTDPEPIPAGHPLVQMSNVLITGHRAASSVQADLAVRVRVAETVARAVRGEQLPPSVNGVVLQSHA